MKTDGTPYGWLDLLAPGQKVVIRNQIKPGFSVSYEAIVMDRYDGIVKIQIPWDGPVKSVEFSLDGTPLCGHLKGRLSLQEATQSNLDAVLDQHTRRAYLQRIYSVLSPLSRAESDGGFLTPFSITDQGVQDIAEVLKEHDPELPTVARRMALPRIFKIISEALRLEQDDRLLNSDTFMVKAVTLMAIWDILKASEENMQDSEGFVFKDSD